MRKHLAVNILIVAGLLASNAGAEEISILKKTEWSHGNEKGYVISYRHNGRVGKNAKVYCNKGDRPMYLVEGLDRGDGVKMGMGVSNDGLHLADFVAPGYMSWAIDIWRMTCTSPYP